MRKRASVIHEVPGVGEIRRQLTRNLRENRLLRKLLRIVESVQEEWRETSEEGFLPEKGTQETAS